jgi:hypothetical protein
MGYENVVLINAVRGYSSHCEKFNNCGVKQNLLGAYTPLIKEK